MQYTVVVRCEEDVCPIRLRACVRYSSLIVSGMGPGSEMKVMSTKPPLPEPRPFNLMSLSSLCDTHQTLSPNSASAEGAEGLA